MYDKEYKNSYPLGQCNKPFWNQEIKGDIENFEL